jgi:hypothetical protein
MKVVTMPFVSIFLLFNFSVQAENGINYVQSSAKNSTPKSSENCNTANQLDSPSKNGIEVLMTIANYMEPSCNSKLELIAGYYKPYSKQYCDKMLSCRNTKLAGLKKPGLIKDSELNAELNLQESLENVYGMERIERVREFAKKKGMTNIGQNCPSRFNPTLPNPQIKCIQRFNNSFKAFSENNENYGDFKLENKSPVINNFSAYFNKRVEYHTTNLISNHDDSNIDKLSSILTMPDKTNEEKKKLFIDFLKKQDETYSLDPILAFQQLQHFEDVHAKFLENVLNQKKILTKEEAKKRLLTYREERAKVILGQKCKESWDFDRMCSSTNQTAAGSKTRRGMSEAVRIFKSEGLRPNVEILKKINASYFPNKAKGEDYESAKFIWESMRCSSFVFDYVNDVDYVVEYSPKLVPKAQAVDDNGNPVSEVVKAFAGGKTSTIVPVQITSAEADNTKASIAAPEVVHEDNHNFPISNPVIANPSVNNVVANNTPEGVMADVNQANVSTATPSTKEKSAAETEIQTKITELSKRLDTATDKIAKMNAEKETSTSASINEEKKSKLANEESKIVNDLKSQINDLKSQIKELRDQKAIIERKNASVNISSNIRPAAVISGVDAVQSQQEKKNSKNADYENGISNNSASASANSNSYSAATNEPKRVYDSSKKPLDIVLSDNSLKASKNFSDAINKKITELDNKPFYIEEGGMIKEIIPILNTDGKVVLDEKGEPMFEKITRGKIGEKFEISKGSILNSAPTTAIGDLVKKDEVEMRKPSSTFQYQQLMKTTADGIKDK